VRRRNQSAIRSDSGILARVRHPSTASVNLLPEQQFLSALSLERKRAERSGKRFVLMLLDRGPAAHNGDGAIHHLLEDAVSAVLSCIRETDIAGWRVANQVLGVIFTELGGATREQVLGALRARLMAALERALPAEALRHLRIAFHCFPETQGDPAIEQPAMDTLYPDLVERDEARKIPRMLKRIIDLLGSALALIVLAPIFLIVAAAIKLSSPGPVLFRQQRIGQFGLPFTFLKFRSMYVRNDSKIHREFVTQFINGNGHGDSEGGNGHGHVYKITDDPRVTPFGRFLRRSSLDELPQLVNVLRGEMSLVGPRPPIQYELDAYRVWHRRRLLEVKPGITGLWQVTGRSRLCFDDMVRLDLQYARAWSLWLDLKILLRTPRAVISREGAY
jgi:exopolysaccharide biosynthesis polyprenyl glycosylphosphotransferase